MTETVGKDFNFFQTVTSTASFAVTPDVTMRFRGPRSMMFIGVSGTSIEYSFNGTTTHGRISSGQILNFGQRNEDKIWFKGSGVIDVHSWRI
jgi:hypothetical protein